jgi:hypothetical protein
LRIPMTSTGRAGDADGARSEWNWLLLIALASMSACLLDCGTTNPSGMQSNDGGGSDGEGGARDGGTADQTGSDDGGVSSDGGESSDAGVSADTGGAGCCPTDWTMYGCTFPEGGTGLACHNPALDCASSNVCGVGCDRIVSGRCEDAAASTADAGCVGPPLINGCNTCLCEGTMWICGTTQCPPAPQDAATDAPPRVMCGGETCGPGEWCDTSASSPTCRCGQVNGSCTSGEICCINPFSGCGPAHCNEHCAATCNF